MNTTIHHSKIIPDSMAGLRLDQALSKLFPDYSRARLQQWIKHGEILVNNNTCKPRYKIVGGEAVTIQAELIEEVEWQAEPIQLAILYEDKDIIVINKPAGLVVHPGAGNPAGTLVNALLHHAPELEQLPRAGIVHRIDKETSGLLVVAKTLAAHTHLVAAMQVHEITREYEAVVIGVMTAGATINEPIARHPKQRTKMAVVHNGKRAITHYRVIKRFAAHTHISVQLETGRTHQIRVHMAHIQHPIVGDPLYAGRLQIPTGASIELANTLRQFKRQALHAKRLSLVHPITKEPMSWEANTPEDIQQLLYTLSH